NAYMTYRGIENFYGDVWVFIDGMNIGGPAGADNYKVHVCNNDTHFADDTWINYTDLGIQISDNSGNFIKTLEPISRGFLPDIGGSGASANTYVCDLFYSEVGQRVIFRGGGATMGLSAGMFCFHAKLQSSADSAGVCGRLSC
ncbi:MAG: hypothetical protein U9R60_17340, partial [Bacteroidota bacterium]|nr:hypothetical protein [Bacteroidota bacterium]